MKSQEELRVLISKYISENGIKYVYIANFMNVSRSTLCHFLKGNRRLNSTNINSLIQYMKDKKVI